MDPRSCPANLLFPSAIWVRGFGMIRKSRSEPTVASSYLSTPNSSSDTWSPSFLSSHLLTPGIVISYLHHACSVSIQNCMHHILPDPHSFLPVWAPRLLPPSSWHQIYTLMCWLPLPVTISFLAHNTYAPQLSSTSFSGIQHTAWLQLSNLLPSLPHIISPKYKSS